MLYRAAEALVEQGHTIAAIITAQAPPEYSHDAGDFQVLAERLGATFFKVRNLDDKAIQSACEGLDMAISTNWISVIQTRHISWFRIGILNMHAGDLPRYRGNACPNWAILHGASEIVCSAHLMEGGQLDSGRVICQRAFPLEEDTSIQDVYDWFDETFPGLASEAVQHLDADPDCTLLYADAASPDGFRCYPRLPEDGWIDWSHPVSQIHQLIRASGPPFAGAYTFYRWKATYHKLAILDSRIIAEGSTDLAVPGHVLHNDSTTGETQVACGEGVLGIRLCRHLPDGEPFAPGATWKSIRLRLGARAEDMIWHVLNNAGEPESP